LTALNKFDEAIENCKEAIKICEFILTTVTKDFDRIRISTLFVEYMKMAYSIYG
jgi:hypothetical protein